MTLERQTKGNLRMNEINLTFFPSYYAYARDLPARERLAFYDAILQYFFDGVECDERNPAYRVFMLVKPNITASLRMKRAKRKPNTSANTCGNTSPNTSANTPSYKEEEEEEGRRNREQRKKYTPPPPTPAASGRAAALAVMKTSFPTRDDVMAVAHNLGIPKDFAERFYADMTRDNWAYVNHHGSTVAVNKMCLASVLGGRWRASKRKDAPGDEEITPEIRAIQERARKAGKH